MSNISGRNVSQSDWLAKRKTGTVPLLMWKGGVETIGLTTPDQAAIQQIDTNSFVNGIV